MDDFFRKSFCEGGITIKQFRALYEELQDIKYDEFKAQARMHGAEFKDDKKSTSTKHVDPEVPLFGDPSEYDHMSEEERENLTKKMMGKHKTFVKQKGF